MNNDERPAPLPPHDRSWRHPSELAQHERRRTFINAPPLSRPLAFVASLAAVAMALVILGLSLPMSPRGENIAASSNRPAGSVRSGVRLGTQVVQTEAYFSSDGGVFTPIRISLDTGAEGFRQFETGTLFIGVHHLARDTSTPNNIALYDLDDIPIPVSLVARDSSSLLALYYSTWSTTSEPLLFTPSARTTADTALGNRVSLLGREPVAATIGLRSAQLDDTFFVPLDVGLAASALAQGTPVVNSRQELIGLFTQKNHASGFVPVSGAWTLVAQAQPTSQPTTTP